MVAAVINKQEKAMFMDENSVIKTQRGRFYVAKSNVVRTPGNNIKQN